MSQRPVDDPPNFSIATSHNVRQNANKHIKNYIFTVSNFWMRYSNSDRKNKSILAKEVLNFIFENGGRVRDADALYDQAYLNSHPTIYDHVINSIKDYISDQITKHKKKFKNVAENIQNFLPPSYISPPLPPVTVLIPTSTILSTHMVGLISEVAWSLPKCVDDLGDKHGLSLTSIECIRSEGIPTAAEAVSRAKISAHSDLVHFQNLPHDLSFHTHEIVQPPLLTSSIISSFEDETCSLLMTRSQKSYVRKLHIEGEKSSFLVPHTKTVDISIDPLIDLSFIDDAGSETTAYVEDKGYLVAATPNNLTIHRTEVIQHPVVSATTILATFKEEGMSSLMTRSRKTYERKLRIEEEPSLLEQPANENTNLLIMPQLIINVVDGTYTPDFLFPQQNPIFMHTVCEIIRKNKIFNDFNPEKFISYSYGGYGGVKQIGVSCTCVLKLKAESNNPLENYVNNEIIDFNFILIRRSLCLEPKLVQFFPADAYTFFDETQRPNSKKMANLGSLLNSKVSFIPIHIPKMYHWCLLLAVNLTAGACNKKEYQGFILFDSLRRSKKDRESSTEKYVKKHIIPILCAGISKQLTFQKEFFENMPLEFINSSIQENSYDCGIYVLKTTEIITRHIFLQGDQNFGNDLPSTLNALVSGITPAHITSHRSNLHHFFNDFFSKPRRTIKYTGFRNGGNDCYLISLAQFLYTRFEWFVNLEKLKFRLLHDSWKKLIRLLAVSIAIDHPKDYIDPIASSYIANIRTSLQNFKNNISDIGRDFCDARSTKKQHCPYEVLDILIQLEGYFFLPCEVTVVRTVKCVSCGTIRGAINEGGVQHIMNVTLPECVTLCLTIQDLLHETVLHSTIPDLSCAVCADKQDHDTSGVDFNHSGDTLLLRLRRELYDEHTQSSRKNMSKVDFFHQNGNIVIEQKTFQLIAVMYHIGAHVSEGHYVVDSWRPTMVGPFFEEFHWHHFDDDKVTLQTVELWNHLPEQEKEWRMSSCVFFMYRLVQ